MTDMHCVWPIVDGFITNWRIEVNHNWCQELQVLLINSSLV